MRECTRVSVSSYSHLRPTRHTQIWMSSFDEQYTLYPHLHGRTKNRTRLTVTFFFLLFATTLLLLLRLLLLLL